MAKCGKYVQQFHPLTGEPSPGEGSYGPTMLALLEYVAYLYGVAIEEDSAMWSAAMEPSASEYTQHMYGRDYTLVRGAGECVALIDGREAFRFSRGARVRSGLDGCPVAVYGLAPEPISFRLLTDGRELTAILHPNEEFAIEDGRLVSRRQVPFSSGDEM